jgi:hypothetical protein
MCVGRTQRIYRCPIGSGRPTPERTAEPAGFDKSALAIGAPLPPQGPSRIRCLPAVPRLRPAPGRPAPHPLAQSRTLGRKVSDEFAVPLYRSHHRALHRSRSEYLWWENIGIDPLRVARKLWKKTRATQAPKLADRRHGTPRSLAHAGIAETSDRPYSLPGVTQSPATEISARGESGGGGRSSPRSSKGWQTEKTRVGAPGHGPRKVTAARGETRCDTV